MAGEDPDADAGAPHPDQRDRSPVSAGTSGSGGSDISAVMHAVGSVAGSTTVIAALLFYFGWARTQAALNYFGLNVAVAHLSADDLVLRSVDVTVRPLALLGLIALALFAGHRWLSATLPTRSPSNLARVALVASALGVLLCIAAFLGLFNWVVYSTRYPFVPILLAVGVVLVGYGVHVRRIARGVRQTHGWPDRAQAMVLAGLEIALVFWAAAVYASISGQQVGERLASNLQSQPSVVVYSKTSLGLAAPEVSVQRLPGAGDQYRYRYSRLRLLLYSDGRYFLVSDRWERGRDPVVLLEEDADIRVEFYR